MHDDCRVWNVPRAPAAVRRPVRSHIPTLMLSGTFDAVTALPWARAAARTLPNARIVRIPGVGHFVVPESRCAHEVGASFLARPRRAGHELRRLAQTACLPTSLSGRKLQFIGAGA
jgi:pimeloyl-ACP methyl ester carboxylesterase